MGINVGSMGAQRTIGGEAVLPLAIEWTHILPSRPFRIRLPGVFHL